MFQGLSASVKKAKADSRCNVQEGLNILGLAFWFWQFGFWLLAACDTVCSFSFYSFIAARADGLRVHGSQEEGGEGACFG